MAANGSPSPADSSSETVLFDGTIVLKDMKTKLIQAAPWNANVMPADIYKQLLEDMRGGEPKNIDPVHVARLTDHQDQLFTIDGAHRVRAATELGWNEIPTVFHNDITTESQARLFNYRRDAERGEIDQFKLAETFKWYVDQGLDHQKIAVLFGIDRSTVTKRLALLNLDERVKTRLLKEEGATISHLEPISTLKPELQRDVVNHIRDYSYGQPITAKGMQNIVDGVKKREALKEQWLERISKSKVPKCPQCKQDPVLPNDFYGSSNYLRCAQRHEWSMTTGKNPNRDALDDMTHAGGQRMSEPPKKAKVWPQKARSRHDPVEFDGAYWSFLKELWPKLGNVDHIDLRGKLKDGKEFHLNYTVLGGYVNIKSSTLSYGTGKYNEKDQVYIHVEELTAPTLKKKGYKCYVSTNRRVTGKKQLEDLAKESEKFLSDYGKVPRGTAVKDRRVGHGKEATNNGSS